MARQAGKAVALRTSAVPEDSSDLHAAPDAELGGAPRRAVLSVATARTAFIEAARRDTPGTDLSRYVAVLDALLAWARAHADQVTLHTAAKRQDVIRFDRAGTKQAFWSVQPTRADAPKLEVHLPAGASRVAATADTLRTLNAHSRDALEQGDRLRIGFGALKNASALAAVLALLDRLLDDASPPVESTE